MTAIQSIADEAGSSSLAGPSIVLQRSVNTLKATIHSLSQTLISLWQGQRLGLDDAETSFASLIPECQGVQAELQQTLTSEAAWSTFREMAAAEMRWMLFASMGNCVDLDEASTLQLYALLDIVTALQETNLVDGSLSLSLIEETNERLAIDSATIVFGYLESRVAWLTRDLSPSRGKGLVLLRLLNDLLRRLSRPSRSHLVLSGRILALLASVFPLGERSGVNLRGEFNVGNVTKYDEDAATRKTKEKDKAVEEEAQEEVDKERRQQADDKDADPAAVAARDATFYCSFWSLQAYFANPTLLFEIPVSGQAASTSEGETQLMDTRVMSLAKTQDKVLPSGAATPQRPSEGESKGTREAEAEEGADEGEASLEALAAAEPKSALQVFRETTRRVLDIFAETIARDQELDQAERAASKGGGNILMAKKRKREEMLQNHAGVSLDRAAKEEEDANISDAGLHGSAKITGGSGAAKEGAFPKFLTGREVFEYQLRSPHFRRHLMLQYLILFQYLLSFNPVQKKKAQDHWKNKQLLLAYPIAGDFELGEDDEQWVRRSWKEITSLLEEMGPKDHGRSFRNSVLQTLRRESRWIHWKAENCPPIDKPGMTAEVLQASKAGRELLMRPRPPLAHSLGTRALSELWENGLEPIVPSSRRIENAEGVEVEVSLDGLEQLEQPPGTPSVATYAKMVKQQEARTEARRRKLDLTAPGDDRGESEEVKAVREARLLAAAAEDEKLRLFEERKTSLNWRALRIARRTSLRFWNKIGGGEVDLLLKAEEDEAGTQKMTQTKKESEGGAGQRSEEKKSSSSTSVVVSTSGKTADSDDQGLGQVSVDGGKSGESVALIPALHAPDGVPVDITDAVVSNSDEPAIGTPLADSTSPAKGACSAGDTDSPMQVAPQEALTAVEHRGGKSLYTSSPAAEGGKGTEDFNMKDDPTQATGAGNSEASSTLASQDT